MKGAKQIAEAAGELVKTIRKYRHILISIKGSPDPDAIGSAFALKTICSALGVTATIASPVYPSLPQNIKIIKTLRLPVLFKCQADSVRLFDAYAIVDHPSVELEGLTGAIPCAIHIDHHVPIEENIPADLKIVWNDVGAVCSILSLILHRLEERIPLSRETRARLATALYLGIQTDTDDFQHMSPRDRQARDLILPSVDHGALDRINRVSFPDEAIPYLHAAIQNQTIHEDWLISGIGYMDEKLRDSLAIIGDFMLKREDISKVVVFALIEKKEGLTLASSLRTASKRFDLNRFIKRITSEGGARAFKGAFQVDLDYFRYCPDREMLWKIVHMTTVEALKKQGVPMETGRWRTWWKRVRRPFRR